MRQFAMPPTPRVNWGPIAAQTDAAEHQAWLAIHAPRRPWQSFTTTVFQPEPGEHVGIIGATGQGKTVLQRNLFPFYPYVAVFATKPIDKEMDRLITRHGYMRLDRWVPLSPQDTPHRVIWPDASQLDSTDKQRRVFEHAMDAIFREGGKPKERPVGWCLAIDELWYISDMLGLSKKVKLYLLQARSLGITLLGATQRPAWIPVEVYSQSTHLFFFRDTDDRNLQRIGEINHSDKRMIRQTVATLEPHQVLYVNTRTGTMARTRTPVPA